MKKKSFNRMLQLNKTTIATLKQKEMNGLVAGRCTFSCDSDCPFCGGIIIFKNTEAGTCAKSNFP